jgi:hypothetical protein
MGLSLSGFFIKQLLLFPVDILKNNFDFNTRIEELFNFKVTPQCIHYQGVSTPRCIHHRGVQTPRYSQLWGVSTPWCIRHQVVTNLTPQCIHYQGVETLWCIQHRV